MQNFIITRISLCPTTYCIVPQVQFQVCLVDWDAANLLYLWLNRLMHDIQDRFPWCASQTYGPWGNLKTIYIWLNVWVGKFEPLLYGGSVFQSDHVLCTIEVLIPKSHNTYQFNPILGWNGINFSENLKLASIVFVYSR